MTTRSGWCLSGQCVGSTAKHPCPIGDRCPCSCHAQVDGQDALIPDPRTTTEPPF
jgi:hypothetical protein